MNNNTRNIIIIIALLALFTGGYLLLNKFTNNNSPDYDEYLKNYKVNEYIVTYVSDEDMAKIYLNEYVHNMYYDVELAYNTLDKEYRKNKFGNLDNYKNYVRSLGYSNIKISKYYKEEKGGYIIFGIYDTNGNMYIFKTKGVMQYSVYLDDYTVEI